MGKSHVEILESVNILSDLSHEDLEDLYGLMKREDYSEGCVLFNEGDTGNKMYIVLSGRVSISVRTSDGSSLEIAEISEGNFLGEMSIFDNAPRSATCIPKCGTEVLSLRADDFFRYTGSNPAAGIAVMRKMLDITSERLQTTGAFLSEMVTWGEAARARAITDEFTGLYNRRFLDDALQSRISEARRQNAPVSIVMVDLDHFGTLNHEYGQQTGDRIITEVTEVFRKVFRKSDILARYGGDEFTFLLPGTAGEKALDLCFRMVEEVRKIALPEQNEATVRVVSASCGIASCPDHGDNPDVLKEMADSALYAAKERGRNTSVLKPLRLTEGPKEKIPGIAVRNRIISRIIETVDDRDSFLIVGHRNPDEDCISSMIALGLILSRFRKNCRIILPARVNDNFEYLLNICRYNSIEIAEEPGSGEGSPEAVFIMDTPKKSMIQNFNGKEDLLNNPAVLKIEIDHHLGADSSYSGDPGYCLVDEASSASELVGLIAFKLRCRKELLEKYGIHDLFTRNFVLSVLTGIIGDSKMGRYLKTKKEKWFYRLFSGMFNDMLISKTRENSANLASMNEVFTEIQRLSLEEDECFSLFLANRIPGMPEIGTSVMPESVMESMRNRFSDETIVNAARHTADFLAEESRFLSLVAYHDRRTDDSVFQFRIRRSHEFTSLDLRDVLARLEISDGGGHPGAIGFRVPVSEVEDISEYCTGLRKRILSEADIDLQNG